MYRNRLIRAYLRASNEHLNPIMIMGGGSAEVLSKSPALGEQACLCQRHNRLSG
jgi:hypothetical protein